MFLPNDTVNVNLTIADNDRTDKDKYATLQTQERVHKIWAKGECGKYPGRYSPCNTSSQ
jgi:hypothetical protein